MEAVWAPVAQGKVVRVPAVREVEAVRVPAVREVEAVRAPVAQGRVVREARRAPVSRRA